MPGTERDTATPTSAAEQMQEATRRVRERAWMVAPLTSPAEDDGVTHADANG